MWAGSFSCHGTLGEINAHGLAGAPHTKGLVSFFMFFCFDRFLARFRFFLGRGFVAPASCTSDPPAALPGLAFSASAVLPPPAPAPARIFGTGADCEPSSPRLRRRVSGRGSHQTCGCLSTGQRFCRESRSDRQLPQHEARDQAKWHRIHPLRTVQACAKRPCRIRACGGASHGSGMPSSLPTRHNPSMRVVGVPTRAPFVQTYSSA